MTAPQVSIIMNCYNAEKYLPQTLASAAAQTFADYEIIFLDNNSTDGSASIARRYGKRLRYFRNPTTVPLGHARNQAISQARGEYIAFLDCDDLWKPEKLERQAQLLNRNPALGLVCTDTEIFDGRHVQSRLFSRSKPERGHVFEQLVARQWIAMSSAMLRRKALDGLLAQNRLFDQSGQEGWFDPRLHVCEEADVFYRVARDWKLDYVDEPLTVWRTHPSSSTFSSFGQFAVETQLILNKLRLLDPDFDAKYPDLVELLARRMAFQRSVSQWKEGNGRMARQTIAPYLSGSVRNRLFWLAAYLPPALFERLSQLYFSLPKFLRR